MCAHAHVCGARAGLSGLLTLFHSQPSSIHHPPPPQAFPVNSLHLKYLPKGLPWGGPVAGTSPSNAGGMGSILGQQAKLPCASRDQNIEQKQCWNKFNKDLKKKKLAREIPPFLTDQNGSFKQIDGQTTPPRPRTHALSLSLSHTHRRTQRPGLSKHQKLENT